MGSRILGKMISSMWAEKIAWLAEQQGICLQLDEMANSPIADPALLLELLQCGSADFDMVSNLSKQSDDKQANAVRLLREEFDILDRQKIETQSKQRKFLEEFSFQVIEDGARQQYVFGEDEKIGDESPAEIAHGKRNYDVDGGDDSIEYWKEVVNKLDHLLSESLRNEHTLIEQIKEKQEKEKREFPFEDLELHLPKMNTYLHLAVKNSPFVIGHHDKDLKYRFVYHHYPTLTEQDIIGKRDDEIHSGPGVQAIVDFKREVLRRGYPAKREITFESELLGQMSYVIAAEPVFCKDGEVVGLNHVAVDVTKQAIENEKLIRLREEAAVQKALESELHKTIHITEETMRAKQMLATMSHEIRSPLAGVVSIAEILATTDLDAEQREMVDAMLSSSDLVLQLINDLADLSKVESGSLKLEAKKFRPREVVKNVLQMAAASLTGKHIVIEGYVAEEVPLEVIGDVLRIRQILTNLVSNAIKFTHQGRVSIALYVQGSSNMQRTANGESIIISPPKIHVDSTTLVAPSHPSNSRVENKSITAFLSNESTKKLQDLKQQSGQEQYQDLAEVFVHNSNTEQASMNGEKYNHSSTMKPTDVIQNSEKTVPILSEMSVEAQVHRNEDLKEDKEATVCLFCEVYDTGIGIPENAIPSLFKEYTQASTTIARKYGGTGLGLAICKQLVELMGGKLSVKSKENEGSTFSFTLKCIYDKEVHNRETNQGQNVSAKDQESNSNFPTKEAIWTFTPTAITSRASPVLTSDSKLLFAPSYNSDFTDTGEVGSLPVETCVKEQEEGSLERRTLEADLPAIECVKTQGYKEKTLIKPTKTGAKEDIVFFDQADAKEEEFRKNFTRSCALSTTKFFKDKIENGIHKKSPTNPSEKHDVQHSKANGLDTIYSGQLERTPLTPCFQETVTGMHMANKGFHIHTNGKHKEQNQLNFLLAEDNKVNVMVARSMIKRFGLQLDVANNGAEAVKAVKRKQYDLILMDVQMPIMDGLEATQLIRKLEQQSNRSKEEVTENCQSTDSPYESRVPIVAMTADTMPENIVEFMAHGMDSFVPKPVTFEKLSQVLQTFFPWLEEIKP